MRACVHINSLRRVTVEHFDAWMLYRQHSGRVGRTSASQLSGLGFDSNLFETVNMSVNVFFFFSMWAMKLHFDQFFDWRLVQFFLSLCAMTFIGNHSILHWNIFFFSMRSSTVVSNYLSVIKPGTGLRTWRYGVTYDFFRQSAVNLSPRHRVEGWLLVIWLGGWNV